MENMHKNRILFYPFIGLMGSVLGLGCQGLLDFYRAQVFMATISILISLLIFAVFHGAMAKNRICRFLFFPLVIGISFFLSLIAVDRSPNLAAAFASEFGFAKPDSVQMEHLEVVPIEFGYYTLMKMKVPQEVCVQILNQAENENKSLTAVEKKDLYDEYKQELELRYYQNKLPAWWNPAELRNPNYFSGGISYATGNGPGFTERILLWGKGQNLAYYAGGSY